MTVRKIIVIAFGLALVCGGGGFVFAEDFFAHYCLKCHGDDPENLEGDADLRSFTNWTRHDWLVLLDQIDSEEMPSKAPYPTRAERDAELARLRERFAKLNFPAQTPPAIRRLTWEEYDNTMRDLLGIDLRAGEFLPADGQGNSGFSNDRTSLAITPPLMEMLFTSAERALDGAFAVVGGNGDVTEFVATKMTNRAPGVKPHLEGMMVVQPTHFVETERNFPVDGYYEFTVDADTIGKRCVAQFYVAGEIVGEVEIASNDLKKTVQKSVIAFVRRGRHSLKIGSKNLVPHPPLPPDFVRLMEARSREKAAKYAAFPNETKSVKILRNSLNLKAVGIQECVEYLAVFGPYGDSREIGQRRKYYNERMERWERVLRQLSVESNIPLTDLRAMWLAQNRQRLEVNESVLQRVAHVEWRDWMQHQGKLYVEKIAVSGPVLPAHVAASAAAEEDWNFIKRMRDESSDLPTLVREFAEQAFSRPVLGKEVAPYIRIAREARERGENRVAALKLAFTAIVVSSDFLFRSDESGHSQAASDLSYFLWLTKPDARLVAQDLSDSKMVEREIDRLIADPRADAFFRRFTDEWLEIGELGNTIHPDRSRWPEFSPDLAAAMREEVYQFMTSLIRENRPVSELLTSEKRTTDAKLSAFYETQKTSATNRAGLLGKGAVLVTTSSPTRTNPVRRGKWVWTNLLGLPIGDPLPDAGELPGDAGEARGKTLREELAIHSSQPECARCHEKIDPIGFGLQNFDATGRWRDLEAGSPVDAAGELQGGGTFSGPVELRRLLLEKRGDDFAKNVAAQLRALFRGVENEPGYVFDTVNANTGLLDLLKAVVIGEME